MMHRLHRALFVPPEIIDRRKERHVISRTLWLCVFTLLMITVYYFANPLVVIGTWVLVLIQLHIISNAHFLNWQIRFLHYYLTVQLIVENQCSHLVSSNTTLTICRQLPEIVYVVFVVFS